MMIFSRSRKDPLDAFLEYAKKSLSARAYMHCVWLMDQLKTDAVYDYLKWRCDIASEVIHRVRDQKYESTLLANFRHARRYHAATSKYVRAVKALGLLVVYKEYELQQKRVRLAALKRRLAQPQ